MFYCVDIVSTRMAIVNDTPSDLDILVALENTLVEQFSFFFLPVFE